MKKTHQLEPEFLDLNVQLIVFGSQYKTVNLYQNEINYCGLFLYSNDLIFWLQ